MVDEETLRRLRAADLQRRRSATSTGGAVVRPLSSREAAERLRAADLRRESNISTTSPASVAKQSPEPFPSSAPESGGSIIDVTDEDVEDVEVVEDGRGVQGVENVSAQGGSASGGESVGNVQDVSAPGGDVEEVVDGDEPPPLLKSVQPPTSGSFLTLEDMAKLQAIISGKPLPDASEVKSSSPVSEGEGEEEVRLSEEGGKLLEMMRTELADLPNPFEKMEAGELDYSYDDKQKEIERRVAKIAAEVLKKLGAANGDKLKELEAIVQQITDELLDRDEAAAAFHLIDVLKRGRKGFDVVLDEERVEAAHGRLFWRGEVASLGGDRSGVSDFETLEDNLNRQWWRQYAEVARGTVVGRDRSQLGPTRGVFPPDDVKKCYDQLLSEGKIVRCLSLGAFVKRKSENKYWPSIYSSDLLSFDTNQDLKQKFIELYRGAVQRLKDKIQRGEFEIDTSDDRAVKEALRPYSALAVQGRLGWGFDWRTLCRDLKVS